jgi:hypothetical protein
MILASSYMLAILTFSDTKFVATVVMENRIKMTAIIDVYQVTEKISLQN